MKRAFAVVCVALICGAMSFKAGAQGYPLKPVRLINPYPPGGGIDMVQRTLAQKMGETLKQNVFVENRAGANGIIGTEIGVRAAPDGYTLIGGTTGSIAMNASVYPKMPYDVLRDLAPIINIGEASFVLVAHPSLAARNVRELVALAKRRPGELSYGTPGVGGTNHLGAEYFSQLTGIRLLHVAFKGSLPMLTDIMGGHVMMAFDSTQAVLPHVRSGRLRAMGIAAHQRSPIAPDIPTIAESGGPEFVLGSWYGVFAPAGTPAEIIARLHAEAVKALANADLRERFLSTGVVPLGNSPEQFGAQVREDIARWGKVARAANVRAE